MFGGLEGESLLDAWRDVRLSLAEGASEARGLILRINDRGSKLSDLTLCPANNESIVRADLNEMFSWFRVKGPTNLL